MYPRIFSILIILVPLHGFASAQNWPQWRGPKANGVSQEENLPERWSDTENLHWKRSLTTASRSTPIVWGERIFLTGQKGPSPIETRGREEGDPITRPPEFLIQSFHKGNGRMDWERSVGASGPLQPTHRKHDLATPSVVTDGEQVFAWFGTGQLLALDLEGTLLWQRHLGVDFAPFELLWAHGSSPILYDEMLILFCDHKPGAYILAVDKKTGHTLWKVDRGADTRSYSTPLIIPTSEGDELILNGQDKVDAYRPSSGRHLWSAGSFCKVPVATPVFDGRTLYINRGYASSPLLAVRPGGREDVTQSHVAWRNPTGAPYVSSLLLYEGLLFMATENGIASALDPETGATVWRQRLGGNFSASPLGADGKVYLFNEEGDAYVLRASAEFELLAQMEMGAPVFASPAVSNGKIVVRTADSLWSIGLPAPKTQIDAR